MKACIFGESSLTIQCAELLLSMGHEILCFVSDKKNIHIWANERNVIYYNTVKEFRLKVNKHSFDYLFSIVNFTILDSDILLMPRYCSINYHDSLLPRYAGVHASAWAILHGEKKHGVTWHVMNSKIDEGNVLAQSEFEIPEKATTYFVNMICYEHAIKTFKTLLYFIDQGNLVQQYQKIEEKTYFGLHRKPVHFGFIQWNETISQIEILFRAAQFGLYDNTFYLPKIILNQNIIVIPAALLTEQISVSERHPCGVVTMINKKSIEISVQDGKVIITQVKDLNNFLWPAGEWFMRHGIEKGSKLTNPDKVFFTLLSSYVNIASRDEKKIVSKLRELAAPSISFHNAQPDMPSRTATFPLKKENIKKVFEKYGYESVTVFIAAIIIYIYKTNQYQNQPIMLENNTEEGSSLKGFPKHLFFRKKILEITLNPYITFSEVARRIIEASINHSNYHFFSADLRLRYPDMEDDVFSIVISNQTEKDSLYPYLEPFIMFNAETCAVTIPQFYEKNTEAHSFFYNIHQRIDKIIQIFLNNDPSINSYNLLCLSDALYTDRNPVVQNTICNSIYDLFDQIVKTFPHRVAIKSDQNELTYAELDRHVSAIANAMAKNRRKGSVKRAVIYLDRSVDFIASILASLKADYTYIPIDISQPVERIHYIVQDIDPDIIITRSIHLLSVLRPYNMLNLDHLDWDDFSFLPISRANETAYIIYTSGTTGKPKGVQVTHRNLNSLFSSTKECFLFSEKDIWVLLHSLSFDFSVWEMWGALIHGGKLVIAPRSIAQSPKDFFTLIFDEQVTVLNQTPSYFNQLMQYANSEILKINLNELNIRYVIFGGEKLNVASVKIWFSLQGLEKSKLINMYGITETTVHASYQEIGAQHLHDNFVPIGRPLDSLEFYVLDEYRQLVQPGLSGELYIVGEGVSLGYWNNPQETQKRFLSLNILGQEKRAYKTGDYVILGHDGMYVYQGRIDSQVKVRGYRVELSEIDAALERQKNVKNSYTTVKKYNNDLVKKIITYVCVEKVTHKIEAKLKKVLSSSLPSYMVPSHIVILKKFPLTVNGKINTKLLPEPVQQNGFHSLDGGPNSPVQTIILNIWASIFENNCISIEDNFFDLGGNSLLLSRMILKIIEIFKKDIAVLDFMNNPTVTTLEKIITCSNMNQKLNLRYNFLNAIALDKGIIKKCMRSIENSERRMGHIFFTGATSFFGMYLLRLLSKITQGSVYILLRGKNLSADMERVRNKYFHFHGEEMPENINAVSGDLEKKKFGLELNIFEQLSEKIDIIVHSAALVNHLFPFEKMKKINVDSTAELIRFACYKKKKCIHYISSLSAAIDRNSNGGIAEDFPKTLENVNQLYNGYVQSKWASEMLLTQAQHSGVAVNIHRLNWILGHSASGLFAAENNHLMAFVQSCFDMGVAPDVEGKIDFFPVDFVVDRIAQVIHENSMCGKVYNYSNPHSITWRDLINRLAISQRCVIRWIPYQGWKEQLAQQVSQLPLYKFYTIYMSSHYPYALTPSSLCVHHANVDDLLTRSGTAYPVMSNCLLNNAFSTHLSKSLKNDKMVAILCD